MNPKSKPKPKPKPAPLYDTDYYVFIGYGDDTCAKISKGPDLPSAYNNWRSGHIIKANIPEPLRYEIHEDDEGVMRPFFSAESQPLMSDGILEILFKCGVDNLDTYRAEIVETRTEKIHVDYKAVNIIGLVAAAGEESETKSLGLGPDDSLVSSWFEKLVISETKAHGFLMFRMAESVSIVIVHRKIKEAVENANLPGVDKLDFIHPARWKG